VRFIVWCGVLAVAPVLGWHLRQNWLLWIGTAVVVVVVPLMIWRLAALFRATNWLLRIGSDGLWINLRPEGDEELEGASVVRLDYAEIAAVGRHTESYSTPSNRNSGPTSRGAIGGSTIWKDQFLQIQLNHEQTEELKAALNNLRCQAVPGQRASARMPVRNHYLAVWLVGPAVLRIAWVSAHGRVVAPRLTRVLGRLDTYVQVAAPTRRDRPDWRKLTADEVDELARELVHVHGAAIEATALLVRGRGATNAEAQAVVQRFDAEGIRQVAHPM
jgi:hypothetical protein